MARLKRLLSGRKRVFALLALLGFANAACILLLNDGYAKMLNAAIAGTSGGIVHTALALALAAAANCLIVILEHALYGRVADGMGHGLRMECAGRALRAECAALDRRQTGDSLTRVTQELRQATDWARGQLCPMVIEAAVLLSVLAAMLLVNWQLTAAAFAVVPLIAFYAVKASKPIRQAACGQQAALAASSAFVKSAIDAFPIVKIFDMAAMMKGRYGSSVDESVRLAVKSNSIERFMMTINGLSSLIPMGILLGAGGAMAISGSITAGALLAYLNLSNFIVGPIMNLPNRIAAARAFSANLSRIDELNADPPESGRLTNGRLRDMGNGNAIELCGVSFAYGEGRPVLNHVSLAVPEGGRAALVGPSGCGKSTVIKLLAALCMPQQGHVRVLGRDTRRWELADLRKQLAVVMQDPFLFPGSILENVACGHDMPMERVLEACRAAGLSELIETIPGGVHADVGERGAKLSGGQRQRVAIARAIAKDAPILLLDEATSALDIETEREIQTALEALMKGRTVLTVTHRLAGIRNAGRIYCMAEGKIAEWGTHDELMAAGGYYAGLVRMQGGEAEVMHESAVRHIETAL